MNVDDFECVAFVTSETLKCFRCGDESHIVTTCPNKPSADGGEVTGGQTQSLKRLNPQQKVRIKNKTTLRQKKNQKIKFKMQQMHVKHLGVKRKQ